jgi:hypothetical protein
MSDPREYERCQCCTGDWNALTFDYARTGTCRDCRASCPPDNTNERRCVRPSPYMPFYDPDESPRGWGRW